MKIGIPRAMMYYKFGALWETFFKELGFEVVLSDNSNNNILNNGLKYSIDESCLASKIFMGHVHNLIGKCDYIFIPRHCSYKDKDITCVKFYALYDICANIFEGAQIITCDTDYLNKKREINEYIKIGRNLNKGYVKTLSAYIAAKNALRKKQYTDSEIQNKVLSEDTNKLNVLIVSHPYVSKDKVLGYPIISQLEKLNFNIIFSEIYDNKSDKDGWKNFSKTIYWKESKELLIGLNHYINNVDGVIFLSVFSCGPDSLVTDLCTRKIKDVPVLNIIIDELNSDTGIQTRLESFTDVLTERKREAG